MRDKVILYWINSIGVLGLGLWIAILFLVIFSLYYQALICGWVFITLMILQNGFMNKK